MVHKVVTRLDIPSEKKMAALRREAHRGKECSKRHEIPRASVTGFLTEFPMRRGKNLALRSFSIHLSGRELPCLASNRDPLLPHQQE